MSKFIRHMVKQWKISREFQEALQLSRTGKKEEAFLQFQQILEKEPHEISVRRQIIILAKELHKPCPLKLPANTISH